MRRLFMLLAGVAAGGMAAAAPPAMKPGLWEITTSMEMPGMPRSMPPTKIKRCYRAEEVQDLRRTLPEQQKANCTTSDWKQSGNTVNWTVSCGGDTPMTMTGSMTYAGDRYSGVSRMRMSQGGQVMHMTQKYDARRIGDCP
ncbi:hypothetical protein SVA_0920 [Sulfurifustis variabilis]|uniref:DUF3617 family protein n=1 Tax=Sulfurifustis variabilis TaxID=1675686 RepID=A0A1B4V1W6_9GAMM|nr:DUF3617 family protein [Sulfurifustis variabilis]BAU47499.1 hypothetical protein SVA_0920 [Sulfurifustis variabilis]